MPPIPACWRGTRQPMSLVKRVDNTSPIIRRVGVRPQAPREAICECPRLDLSSERHGEPRWRNWQTQATQNLAAVVIPTETTDNSREFQEGAGAFSVAVGRGPRLFTDRTRTVVSPIGAPLSDDPSAVR